MSYALTLVRTTINIKFRYYFGCSQRTSNKKHNSQTFVELKYSKIEIINIIVSQFIVLIYFSLLVKAATLIFISGRGSAIASAKEGKSGFIYNLVKSQ